MVHPDEYADESDWVDWRSELTPVATPRPPRFWLDLISNTVIFVCAAILLAFALSAMVPNR